MAANGIREIRLSDPSNTSAYWKQIIRAATEVALRTILNLIFSISPRHTDEYYAEVAGAGAPTDRAVYFKCALIGLNFFDT